MCAVPNMAVFCTSLTSSFPGILLTYFLNDFEIVPVAPIFNWYHLCFYIPHVLIIIIIIIIITTAVELSLGGSSPYTSTDKKIRINIHKQKNKKHGKYKYTFVSLIKAGLFWRFEGTHYYTAQFKSSEDNYFLSKKLLITKVVSKMPSSLLGRTTVLVCRHHFTELILYGEESFLRHR